MRLAWYAGASTALAASVVVSAFHQRDNFYSAMVHLAQSSFCLIVIVNFILMMYTAFMFGLQRLCFGQLRPIETEQLYERTWYAITETLLAMTMFRDEIGAWFLVMFTALVTGRVWGWIGDGRVEVLEQQPPSNPRLFHTRLSVSLFISIVYDLWILRYVTNTVIDQAKPTMMVMFLFEFAVLAIHSVRTAARYFISIYDHLVTARQTREGLQRRRIEVRATRLEILQRRETEGPGSDAHSQDLPNEDDVDEMDIEVPGWESKGLYILGLELAIDLLKCIIYVAFFAILLVFFTMPLHIMRDLFFTFRSLLKRINAIVKYRKAVRDMDKYGDASEEDLARENTCIICREEMRPWRADPRAVERNRPKKLPCDHILHFGCLKSWLERQQVCPTCRRPVTGNTQDQAGRNNRAGAGGDQGQQQAPADQEGGRGDQARARNGGGMRVFNLGPLRLGFAQGDPQQIEEMADRFNAGLNPNLPADDQRAHHDDGQENDEPTTTGNVSQQSAQPPPSSVTIRAELATIERRIQHEIQALNQTYQELHTVQLLAAELSRIRRLNQSQTGPIAVAQPAHQVPIGLTPLPPVQWPLPAPYIPQRVATPAVTRHVATGSAIPAGSADLPEGVVLPPGWSLLPLNRVDAQQSTATTSVHGSYQISQLMQQHLNSLQSQGLPSSDHVGDTLSPPTAQPEGTPSPNVTNEEVESSSSIPQTDHTAIDPETRVSQLNGDGNLEAPSPLVPTWARGAQIFGAAAERGVGMISGEEANRDSARGDSQRPPEPASGSNTSTNKAEGDKGPISNDKTLGEDGLSSERKGKARAVTVEDAAGSEEEE